MTIWSSITTVGVDWLLYFSSQFAHDVFVVIDAALFELSLAVSQEELDRLAGQRIRLGKDDDLARRHDYVKMRSRLIAELHAMGRERWISS